MAVNIKNSSILLRELCAIPGGEGVRLCIQCGTCTASCPNAKMMDYTPRQVIAMARAGLWDSLLSSNSMWLCLSCYLCTVRCPRGIKPTDLMHAFDSLAVRYGLSNSRIRTPKMYKSFSDYVYSIGSVQEMGFMTWYYLLSNPLRALKMIPVALNLLKHGRLSARARRLKPDAERQLKAVLDKAEALGGMA